MHRVDHFLFANPTEDRSQTDQLVLLVAEEIERL